MYCSSRPPWYTMVYRFTVLSQAASSSHPAPERRGLVVVLSVYLTPLTLSSTVPQQSAASSPVT